MANETKKKAQEAGRSLRKMLEILQPYLPPKPEPRKPPCEDWQISESSTPETTPTGDHEKPKHRESL
jgi:hypothetical protein